MELIRYLKKRRQPSLSLVSSSLPNTIPRPQTHLSRVRLIWIELFIGCGLGQEDRNRSNSGGSSERKPAQFTIIGADEEGSLCDHFGRTE